MSAPDSKNALFPVQADQLKRCERCRKRKPLDAFSKERRRPDGLSIYCRLCWKALRKERRRNGKAHAYYLKRQREYRGFALRNFGLTIEQYEEMLAKQGGVCAICQRPEKRKGKRGTPITLSVDHCHRTDKIRGLLCYGCNNAIGLFGDDPALMQKAIAYVRRHS
jgi:hypothetical protein